MLEPDHERRGKIDPAHRTKREMGEHRHIGGLGRRRAAARLAEGDAGQPQGQCAEGQQQPEDQYDREQRLPRKGRTHDEEFAHEDAERRQPGDRDDADHQPPAEHRMGFRQAADPAIRWVPLICEIWPTAIEDRRLGQAVHHHVQQPGEIGQRAAHAEREHDDAHVLDRGIGEQPLDVAPAVQHEGGEDQRHQPHRHHQRTGGNRAGLAASRILKRSSA